MNNHIVFDSEKNKYQPVIFAECFLHSTIDASSMKLINKEKIVPDRLVVLDNIEYYLINLYTKEDTNSLVSKIIQKDLRSTYNEPTRIQFSLLPNANDLNLAMVFLQIESLSLFRRKDGGKILQIYAQKDSYFLKTEDGKTTNPVEINKYLLRNTITKSDSEVIDLLVNNQKEIEIVNNKPKFSLFKVNEKKKEEKEQEKEINQWNLTESEKQFISFESLKVNDGILNSDEELAKLTGLENVKDELRKLKAKLEYRRIREARGIYDESITNLHMCFLGNPGTGKTTVARILTGILYELGYVKNNKCIELNANDFKAGYAGQTAIKTKAILRNARNKVLFIDEAYGFFDGFQGGYGQEAIDVIIKEMEDNKDSLIIIFAGYDKEMNDFLNMNEGLKSRINRYIHFDNYTPQEECEIMMNFLNQKQLLITRDSLEKCMLIFKNAILKPDFANGRFARNLLEKIEEEHAFNVKRIKDERRRDTIEAEDISTEIIKDILGQNR
jgi:DNA polymerase III delta prime subunit